MRPSTKAKRLSPRGISAGKRYKTIEAFALVQKRFLPLSVFLPLSFASSMATNIIYAEKSSRNYFKCLSSSLQRTTDRCTYAEDLDLGRIASVINWILTDLCVLALVAYCLIPNSARTVWSQIWRKCKKGIPRRQRYDDDRWYDRTSKRS